jgi:hypothetical protein
MEKWYYSRVTHHRKAPSEEDGIMYQYSIGIFLGQF